jgi:dihydroflavonol-4-reductase
VILVTGATGFLGRNLVPRLLEAGYPVRVLARPASDTAFLVAAGADVALVDDITDAVGIKEAIAGCRYVIHAAARFRMWGNLLDFWRTNVAGTATVLEAAAEAGVERFVHVSSIVVVGKPEAGRVIDEMHPCHPQDAYQRTKLEGELLALAYWRERDLPVIVLRPGALFGPWGRYAFNRLFFEEPLRGWRIRVNRGKHLTFPAYAPDVAWGLIAALSRGRPGTVYNLCGEPLTHNAVNQIISDLAGISRWRFDMPTPLVLALAHTWTALSRFTGREPFYPADLAHYVFQDWPVSSDRARHELGFAPTPFVDGARKTLAWYRAEGLLL